MDHVLECGDNTTKAMREIERHLYKMEFHACLAKESSEHMNTKAEEVTKSIEHINDTLIVKSDAGLALFSETMDIFFSAENSAGKLLTEMFFGRKHFRPKNFRPKMFSAGKFAVRIAKGGDIFSWRHLFRDVVTTEKYISLEA